MVDDGLRWCGIGGEITVPVEELLFFQNCDAYSPALSDQ